MGDAFRDMQASITVADFTKGFTADFTTAITAVEEVKEIEETRI